METFTEANLRFQNLIKRNRRIKKVETDSPNKKFVRLLRANRPDKHINVVYSPTMD